MKFTKVTEVVGNVTRCYEGSIIESENMSSLDMEDIFPSEVVDNSFRKLASGPKCKIKITVECELLEANNEGK